MAGIVTVSISIIGDPAFAIVGFLAIHYFPCHFSPVNHDGLTTTEIDKWGAPKKFQIEDACCEHKSQSIHPREAIGAKRTVRTPIQKRTQGQHPRNTQNKKLRRPAGFGAVLRCEERLRLYISEGYGMHRASEENRNSGQPQLIEMQSITEERSNNQLQTRGCVL